MNKMSNRDKRSQEIYDEIMGIFKMLEREFGKGSRTNEILDYSEYIQESIEHLESGKMELTEENLLLVKQYSRQVADNVRLSARSQTSMSNNTLYRLF